MREIAAFGGLLIAHAEDGDLVTTAHGDRYADFVASRPAAAEDAAIARLLAAARATGARVHIVHLSAGGRAADARGRPRRRRRRHRRDLPALPER